MFLLELNMVLWWRKWTWMTGLTSSFVNRNTYATYAGLGLLCAVGLLITTVYRDLRSRRLRRLPWRARLMRITWQGWWVVGAVLCLAFALILTRSRGGVTSSAVALAVLIGCFGATRLMRWRDVLVSGGAALALAVGVFVLGGDDLAAASSAKGIESPRYEAYQRIAQAIGEAPWLGTGYGTFPDVFRGYQQRRQRRSGTTPTTPTSRTPSSSASRRRRRWSRRSAGSPRCARSLQRRRRSALYPCLGVAATVLVGLHALLDFSLEIPAVAVAYAAILGVAFGRARGAPTAAAGGPQARRWRGPPGARARARRRVALALLALAVPRLAAELTGLPARSSSASSTPGGAAAGPARPRDRGRSRGGGLGRCRRPLVAGRARRAGARREAPGCCPTRGAAGSSAPTRPCGRRSPRPRRSGGLGAPRLCHAAAAAAMPATSTARSRSRWSPARTRAA